MMCRNDIPAYPDLYYDYSNFKLFYSHHFGVIGFVALWLLYYSI